MHVVNLLGGNRLEVERHDSLCIMSKVFIVYILLCADKSYYTGMTSNMDQRLEEHQEGKYPNCYTASRRPVELVWNQLFDNTHDAITWERRIHGWSRKKKEALIREEWDLIEHLSKRKGSYQKKCLLTEESFSMENTL
jgi:putative endonuclease